MNKKAKVKMLLDLLSDLKNIPTNKDNSIDVKRFYNVPEIIALITILRHLKVDSKYLYKNGFIIAQMLLGTQLTGMIKYKCFHCKTKNEHIYYGKDNIHYCIECGSDRHFTLSSTNDI